MEIQNREAYEQIFFTEESKKIFPLARYMMQLEDVKDEAIKENLELGRKIWNTACQKEECTLEEYSQILSTKGINEVYRQFVTATVFDEVEEE